MYLLIADSNKTTRSRLREIVSRWPWVSDVSEAESEATLGDVEPDFLILDADLPGIGPGGIAGLRRDWPHMAVIVIGPDDPDRLRTLLAEGASGYLRRSEAEQSLRAAVLTVQAGGVHIPPLAALRPVEETLMTSAGPVPAGFFRENAVQYLTRRQCEVLAMIRDDWSNTDIAEVLGVTVGTVKIHITAIFKALGVRNRVQARIAAERIELPDPPPRPTPPGGA